MKLIKKLTSIILTAVMISTCALGYSNNIAEVQAAEAGTGFDLRDESIYSVMITRFYDGDTGNNIHCWDDAQANNPDSDPAWRGDFKGLIDKIQYIKALGFTAIMVTPVSQSASGYDYNGEHPFNLMEVDPRLESDGYTYEDFVQACHDMDMKVVQSIVINSTGNFGEENMYPIMDKVKESADSKESILPTRLLLDTFSLVSPSEYYAQAASNQYLQRLYMLKNNDDIDHDYNDIYHHYLNVSFNDYQLQIGQVAGDAVDLNTENPLVYNYLIEVYKKYIEIGVDAFVVKNAEYVSRLTYNKVFNNAIHSAAESLGKEVAVYGETSGRSLSIWYSDKQSLSTPFYTWKDTDEDNYFWSKIDWETNYNSAMQYTIDHYDYTSAPTSNNHLLNGITYHTPDYSNFSGMNVVDFPMQWNYISASNAFIFASNTDQYYNDATNNIVRIDSFDYNNDLEPNNKSSLGTQDWAEKLALLFTFRGIPCITAGTEVEFQKGMQMNVGPNAPLSTTGHAYLGDYLEGSVSASDFGQYAASGTVSETLNSTLATHIRKLNMIRHAIPALRKGQYTTSSSYVSGDMAFIKRYTDSNEGIDSLALVTISGGATFKNIPNGKYIDAVTGDVKNVTNGTLTVSSISTGNMRVYVCCASGFTSIDGAIGSTGNTYLKSIFLSNSNNDTLKTVSEETSTETTAILPEKITLSPRSLHMNTGDTIDINLTFEPANATNKNVTLTSYGPDIVTAEGNKITAIGEGRALVTAVTDNNVRLAISVTVNDSVQKTLSSIKVEYKTTDGDVILEKTINGYVGDEYDVEPIALDGYVTVHTPSNTSGTFQAENDKITFVYAKAVVPQTTPEVSVDENYVYFKNNSGWGSAINAYMFSSSTYVSNSAWPGAAMTQLGDNVYATEITGDFDMIIFNDGANQTADLTLKKGKCYEVSTGTWSEINLEGTPKPELKLTSASMELEKNITLIYKADATVIDEKYHDCFIQIFQEKEDGELVSAKVNGVKSADGTQYEFRYTGIDAKEVVDFLDVTLFAYDAENSLYASEIVENYSVKQYCRNQLDNISSLGLSQKKQAAFQTLLVDLLNYASEAQLYFDYKTSTLANTDLSETERAYASNDQLVAEGNLTCVTNPNYATTSNPSARWKSGTLVLLNRTTLRLKFAYDGDISKVNMIVVYNENVYTITEFEKVEDGVYYAYFDDFTAAEYGVSMYFNLVADNKEISNVLCYNVESYIKTKMADENLNLLLKSLAKYGKSAKAYVATN